MYVKSFDKAFVFAVLALSIEILSAKTGLNIFTEPGVDVYVDHKFMGTSDLKKGGLHLDQVSAGEHVVTLYKIESLPQKSVIIIEENEVYNYFTEPFSGGIHSGYTNNILSQRTGQFTIQSYPINLDVKIARLDLHLEKTHDKVMLKEIEEGMYELVFTWNEKQLTKEVFIKPNQHIKVWVNMETEVIQLNGFMHNGEYVEPKTIVLNVD